MSFVQFTPRPGATERVSAFDFNALHRLKRSVTEVTAEKPADPSQLKNGVTDAEREVAGQFEALFVQQILKQARRQPLTDLFQSDGVKFAQSLADQQAALELAKPGIGLADKLLDMIRSKRGVANGSAPAVLPELAASRLPHLRSSIGESRQQVAGSAEGLINMIGSSRNALAERVHGAIDGAPKHIRDFVSRMSAAAKVASEQSGVHAKLILGQAALESGWGKREILDEDGRQTYNVFGIKAGKSWKGDVAYVTTTEYVDGQPRRMKEPFRAYGSYEEAFADYAKLVGKSERYEKVVSAPSAEAAAKRIQEAGYATDPAYAQKLISVMSYFDTGRKLRG